MLGRIEANIAQPPLITYLFDPLCGWCYGASAVLGKLNALEEFSVALAPTGLFSNENAREMNEEFARFAWSNDQRIGQLTGQPFSEHYRLKVLAQPFGIFDSAPATLALTAVHATAPTLELGALNAIQQARYVDGKDIAQFEVLARTLRDAGLDDAADSLLAQDETLLTLNRARVDKSRSIMAHAGARGVPTLAVSRGSDLRVVTSEDLFGDFATLLDKLRGN